MYKKIVKLQAIKSKVDDYNTKVEYWHMMLDKAKSDMQSASLTLEQLKSSHGKFQELVSEYNKELEEIGGSEAIAKLMEDSPEDD